jgi:hypothetical protein
MPNLPLLSPGYVFAEFCYHAPDSSLPAIIEAANAESSRARTLHRHTTHQAQFRPGTKGHLYCEQLRLLVFMLVNGVVPPEAPVGFKHDVAPLVRRLLEHHNVGALREEFSSSGA